MTQAITVDKSQLLKELAIVSGANTEPAAWPVRLVAICMSSLLLIDAAFFWFSRSSEDKGLVEQLALKTASTPNTALVSRTLTEQTSGGGSEESVLDASGYVVARLVASVSAKITGKVMEVMIEEGMALLDDAVAAAQLELVIAELNATKTIRREPDSQIRRARLDFERARSLVQKQLVSQSRLDTVSADLQMLIARSASAVQTIEVSERRVAVQRVALADLIIRAPFDGVEIRRLFAFNSLLPMRGFYLKWGYVWRS